MKYSHIVFDIDGTLINNAEALLSSLQEVMKEETGQIIPMEQLAFSMGITGEDTLSKLQVKDVDASMKRWIEILANYHHLVSVYDGISEVLEQLKQQGYHLGIVSSKPRAVYKDDFAPLAIAAYFETVICADDTVEHKPTAAPLLKYMEKASASYKEILYIGDSDYDRQCAENAKTDFAAAGWNPQVAAKSAVCFKHPSELLAYLDDALTNE